MADEILTRKGPVPPFLRGDQDHVVPKKTGRARPPRPPGRPKWVDHQNHGRVRKSRVQEQRVADRMGGKTLPASGSRRVSEHIPVSARGDIATPKFHVEQKSTENRSMSLELAWLKKVEAGAAIVGKDPALVISFTGVAQFAAHGTTAGLSTKYQGRQKPSDWVVISMEAFQRLTGLDPVDGD